MESLIGKDLNEIEALIISLGAESYRAKQILNWIYNRKVASFDEMTNIPLNLRQELVKNVSIYTTSVIKKQEDADGTFKIGLSLHDGEIVESVLIKEGDRNTACVSSQVGCPIKCVFCASGKHGLFRNLTPGEMVEELLHLERIVSPITNIVIMGIGEPLINPNLKRFLDITTSPTGLGFSPRRITISTSGMIPGIENLAKMRKGFNLAVSLHTVNDKTRHFLVPGIAFKASDIVQAARKFFLVTGRAVTFEVVLLAEINDSYEEARDMAKMIRGFPVKVNVIPYNPVPGLPYAPPSLQKINKYIKVLTNEGISAVIRKSKGTKIDAACGQLRLNSNSEIGNDS